MFTDVIPNMRDRRFDCITYVIGEIGIDSVIEDLSQGCSCGCAFGAFELSEDLEDDIR